MGNAQIEKILILAKTYPSPSSQYSEISCVAGIKDDGTMRRLFPIPFRMLESDKQFKKWQWIEARVRKAKNDHRPESHRVDVETVECKDIISTEKNWQERLDWINKIPTYYDVNSIEADRLDKGISLALLKPKRIEKLIITKEKDLSWTQEELEKLLQEQKQFSLFDENNKINSEIKILEKIPFGFYYTYICDTAEGEKEFKNKIVDWEVCALFRKCQSLYGNDWEVYFRKKLEGELLNKNLMFLMGNMHVYRHQWLIISLFYPPKQKNIEEDLQSSLF